MNESHQDRDADGRRQQEEPDRRPLSEEEMERAKTYLEGLENLKANGLSFKVELAGEIRVIVIADQVGNVVRRIPEHEMRFILNDGDRSKGQIFNRAG